MDHPTRGMQRIPEVGSSFPEDLRSVSGPMPLLDKLTFTNYQRQPRRALLMTLCTRHFQPPVELSVWGTNKVNSSNQH